MAAARALPALPTLGELLSAARIAVSIHPVARAAIILTALLTPTTLGDDSCRNKACGLANDDGKADGDQGDAEADGSAGGDLSGHAQDRMGQRGVSPDRVKEAQEKGRVKPGNTPLTEVREVPASQSASGRGIKIVVDTATGRVITVIDKGSKFK